MSSSGEEARPRSEEEENPVEGEVGEGEENKQEEEEEEEEGNEKEEEEDNEGGREEESPAASDPAPAPAPRGFFGRMFETIVSKISGGDDVSLCFLFCSRGGGGWGLRVCVRDRLTPLALFSLFEKARAARPRVCDYGLLEQ
jgi:hypothetical protein